MCKCCQLHKSKIVMFCKVLTPFFWTGQKCFSNSFTHLLSQGPSNLGFWGKWFRAPTIDCGFQNYFSYITVAKASITAFLEFFFFSQISTQYFFQATGSFPRWPSIEQSRVVKDEWILSQWLLSVFEKNIGKPGIDSATSYYQVHYATKSAMLPWQRQTNTTNSLC